MGYEIDFLAVGEGSRSGDAIALRFGDLLSDPANQTVVIVDGGYKTSGENLVKFVNDRYRTNHVDLVVSTHPDADHAAGLQVVLDQMDVDELWLHQPWNHTDDIANLFEEGRVTDQSVRRQLREALDSARDLEKQATDKGIPIVQPFAGLTRSGGKIRVLGPTEGYYRSLLPGFRDTPAPKTGLLMDTLKAGASAFAELISKAAESLSLETLTDGGTTSAENNSSVILLLELEGRRLLLTGDAGIPALTGALDELDTLPSTGGNLSFVQVPHHGSHHNVGPTLLDRLLGPKRSVDEAEVTAFVSAAPEGAPKHPAKKVTNAFRRRGAPVHATAGTDKWHHVNSPARQGYSASTPLPFYAEVED